MLLYLIAMAPPSSGTQSGSGGGIMAFLPMILIFVILYFLILRPQAKRQRTHQQMIEQLQKGDRVVTTGGVHGVIVRAGEKEPTIIVKVADDVKLEIDRNAIARIISDADTSR
ncbi:MAG: preprotein translocase subunit YajC [Calditrichota bacterium]